MTVQRCDFIYCDGQRNVLAAAAPPPFAPTDFDLHFGGPLATNCYRGFCAEYESVDGQLRIRELRLSISPRDRDSVVSGRIWGQSPEFVAPTQAVFRGIPLAYTGALIARRVNRECATSPEFVNPHGILTWEAGRLVSEHWSRLACLPDGFTPESVWVDYGNMMWLPSESNNGVD